MTPFAQQVLAWIIILLVVALALMVMRRLWRLFRAKTSRSSQPTRMVRPTVAETPLRWNRISLKCRLKKSSSRLFN